MNNNQNRLSRMKHQLQYKKINKEEYVIWQLRNDQKEYIERLGYCVIPWVYEITTKCVPNVSHSCALLKEIHYANRIGKRKIYKVLKQKELKILQSARVEMRVFKYKIFL